MLRETAIKAIVQQFGESVILNPTSSEFATFAAKHPDVGCVSIVDDDDELTVYVGDIHHGHFGSYEVNLSDEEHSVVIATDVVNFLVDLFDDKYLLYKSRWGGGWRCVEDGFKKTMLPGKKSWFKWSGPVHRDGATS